MSPSQRRRIVFGLSLLLVGIVVSVVGPVFVGVFLMPKDASDMMRYMTEVNRVGSLMGSIIVGGMAVAAVGFVLAFVEWMRWFVGSGASVKVN